MPQFFSDLEKYNPEEVAKINEIDGENAVIYGMPCFRIEKGYPYEGFIFLSDDSYDFIGFSNKYYDNIKNNPKEYIELQKKIENINFKSEEEMGDDYIKIYK